MRLELFHGVHKGEGPPTTAWATEAFAAMTGWIPDDDGVDDIGVGDESRMIGDRGFLLVRSGSWFLALAGGDAATRPLRPDVVQRLGGLAVARLPASR